MVLLRSGRKSPIPFCVFPKVQSTSTSSGSAPVYLNVYDLTPINGYMYWLGLGIYHTGVEGAVSCHCLFSQRMNQNLQFPYVVSFEQLMLSSPATWQLPAVIQYHSESFILQCTELNMHLEHMIIRQVVFLKLSLINALVFGLGNPYSWAPLTQIHDKLESLWSQSLKIIMAMLTI